MKNVHLFIITTVVLLTSPDINFGQEPTLGATSSFTLFTAVGALSNVGATNVIGDVGTNVGAFTGFSSDNILGQIHVADSTSSQAAIDVSEVYNYFTGITCGVSLGSTLGNGQVMTPNIYCVGTASTLNGDLILDAQGDSNAVFIFKIDGALSTGTFSNIILINSASSCKVYWQINGAFVLGDNSVFEGTIIANGAISLLENSSFEGRALSVAGAISLHSNSVAIGTRPTSFDIDLLSFDAHQIDANVLVSWATASETNNDYFSVERSIDGIYFEKILRVKGAGNSNEELYYSAIDNHPYTGTSYYRLKQTDFNGKYSYSNIVTVYFLKSVQFEIYPNPFRGRVNIIVADTFHSNLFKLCICNVLGVEMLNVPIIDQLTTLETVEFPVGIYFYKVYSNNGTIQSGKLISQ